MPDWILVEKDHPTKVLECADIALIASGSATLEAAVFGTPMVIVYKMSMVTWWLSKLLINTKYVGMVNIIAGKKIMPEFLQNQAIAQSITNEIYEMLSSRERQDEMAFELLNVQQQLQGEGASHRAAQHIITLDQSIGKISC